MGAHFEEVLREPATFGYIEEDVQCLKRGLEYIKYQAERKGEKWPA